MIDCGVPDSAITLTTMAVYYGCQPYDPDPNPWKPSGLEPWPSVPSPLIPPSMLGDEFEIMRALDALDDDARKRVLEWLKTRVNP